MAGMRKSKYGEEQIIGFLNRATAAEFNDSCWQDSTNRAGENDS
jgi:hypothetical protein